MLVHGLITLFHSLSDLAGFDLKVKSPFVCAEQQNDYNLRMSRVAQKIVNSSLSIGPAKLSGRAFLAPMSGVTDLAMRRIADRFGAGLVVSEMVASDDYVAGRAEMRLRAEGQGLSPHVVQIAGCEVHWMADAARLAQDAGADVIDINMGCPAKHVTGGQSGSALMRDLDHAQKLIAATAAAVSIPVTLKMRLGWDHLSLNAPELAARAQAEGVAMITVHGRTRQQFYKGQADWGAIAAVRAATSLPLVANGDIHTLADAQACLAQSGADAVMVGRAALGRPWLVGMLARGLETGQMPAPPSRQEQLTAALEHYESLISSLGVENGTRHSRKHLAAYVEQLGELKTPAQQADRESLVRSLDPRHIRALLTSFFVSSDQESLSPCLPS
jgi:nifR3 family TIM-barrel protein